MSELLINIFLICVLVFLLIIVPIFLVIYIIDQQKTLDNNIYNNNNAHDTLNQSCQKPMDIFNYTILGIP